MQTTRFERKTLAKLLVAGWVVFFGAAIEHAQAQTVNPVPPPPPPVFNPSPPSTVPQPPEIPVPPSSGAPLSPSSETAAPQSPVTPVPPSSETPAPQSPVTPVPPSSETPAPQSPVTPVPPSRGTPVSPGNSSAIPGSGVGAPAVGGPPSASTPSQQQVVPSTAVTSKPAKARRVPSSHKHHRLSGSRGSDGAAGVGTTAGSNYYTPSYYFRFGWGHGWHSCVWQRGWDREWFHDCI
jgi:hypothetical protein